MTEVTERGKREAIGRALGEGLALRLTMKTLNVLHDAQELVDADVRSALAEGFVERLVAEAVGLASTEHLSDDSLCRVLTIAVTKGLNDRGVESLVVSVTKKENKTTAPEVPSRQPAPREATGPEALLMAWARLVKGRSYKVSKCVDGHGKWAITLEGPFFAPETASYSSIDELDSGLTSAANFALDDALDEMKRRGMPATIDILGEPGACYARVNLRDHHYCTTVRVDVWQARAEALVYLHTLARANTEDRIFLVDPLDVWRKQAEKNGYDIFEFSPGHWGYRLLERGRPCAITAADFPSREEARKHAAEKANDLMEEDS